MKGIIIRLEAGLLLTSIIWGLASCGSNNPQTNNAETSNISSRSDTAGRPSSGSEPVQIIKLTDQELDQLLAPIALYPDPLLAQMIPAATFVDQIKEAQQTLNGKSDDGMIADQNWDISVKSIAHYPPVLKMMADDEDWTTTLGQAYINQPDDISKSIQRLRSQASDAGNLKTTPQQQVIEKNNVIQIEPAQPKVIYVPQYDVETVYTEQPQYEDTGVSAGTAVAIGAIAFGVGMAIGAWLNRDYDYYGPGIYYHGWAGPGWVGVNRAYVNLNRNVYINDSYRNINVNRNIVDRNVVNYRGDLTRNAVDRNQRVVNARMNRQLNRPAGGNLRAESRNRELARDPGPSRDMNRERNPGRERNPARELNRTRDLNNRPNGNRSNIDRRNAGNGSRENKKLSRPNGDGGNMRRNSSPRQRPNTSPRQTNRPAPSSGGARGGRRRG